MTAVCTKYFRIAPGRYVRQASLIWLGRWWWTLALPLAALVIAGMFDARFYIIALGTVLIVYPMIMAHIFFSYALRPESALAVVPHTICISAQGLDITYLEEEGRKTPAPRRILISDIDEVEDTGSAIIVHLKSGKYDFIEMPADQFEPGEMAKALSTLRNERNLA